MSLHAPILRYLSAFLVLCFLSGCGDDSGEEGAPEEGTETSADGTETSSTQGGETEKPAPPPEPDDADAVKALEAVATSLGKDEDGFVTLVNFRESKVTDEDLKHLTGLRRVSKIQLNEMAISDDGLAPLAELKSLEDIDLRGCPVSNDGMKHLAGLTSLKAIRLNAKDGDTTVDDDGLAHFAKLVNVKALAMDSLWVSEVGLGHLKELKKLEELYLANTTIGDETLAVLTQFPKLKKLRISECQIGDAGLAHVAKVSSLQELDLSQNALITDTGLSHLAKLSNLKKLNLWLVANISNDGIGHLSGLNNLEWLNLDKTVLTNEGLPHVAKLKKLKFLHLGSTGVTDAGLPHLEGLKDLKDLMVTRTAVTADGVSKLKTKLPNTTIQLRYVVGSAIATSQKRDSETSTSTTVEETESRKQAAPDTTPSGGSVREALAILKQIERDGDRDRMIAISADLARNEVALPEIVAFYTRWSATKEKLRKSLAEKSPGLKPMSDRSFRHADTCQGTALNAILDIQWSAGSRAARQGKAPKPLSAPFKSSYQTGYDDGIVFLRGYNDALNGREKKTERALHAGKYRFDSYNSGYSSGQSQKRESNPSAK